jgi:hypothetical protein
VSFSVDTVTHGATPRFVSIRTRIATPTITVVDALAWLRANDAKRADTFCEADGTVECWKRQFNRRRNGTIVGFHDGAQGRWVSYRRDAREYVEHKIREAEAIERERSGRRGRLAPTYRAAVREYIAKIRKCQAAAASLTTMSQEDRADLSRLVAESEAAARCALTDAWALYRGL